ncbi:hypothetical protein [Tabrizicola sp. BL-A-41-H6]|uniref:COG3904 family protein n=1 Tax=Tabrizicola sp. BL-A-41-H6 TaxID=3421107 RepID=UPI003D67D83F
MEFYYAEPQTDLERLIGGHFHINAVGKIQPEDDKKLSILLDKLSPPPRTTVYINSSGGDVDAAMGIGRIFRSSWFSTSVGTMTFDYERDGCWVTNRVHNSGICYSAAALAYLGGRLRFLPEQFEFGVHQFSFKDPDLEKIGAAQIISARISTYLDEMGIRPEFAETAAAIPGSEILLLDRPQLTKLGLITGGQTGVSWSVEARNKLLYVKGERDSLHGHQKVMLCYAKGAGFQFWSVIESQGREAELTAFGLVEIVLNGESERIDISGRCNRGVFGNYVNVFSDLTEPEARKLAYSESFGVQIRFSREAPLFLGVSAMDTSDGNDKLVSFVENLSS